MRRGTQLFVLLTTGGLLLGPLLAANSARQNEGAQERRDARTGVYSAAQAERGAQMFRKACGYCHRDNLSGDYGPPLVGVDFTYPWDGRTLAELYEKMSSTMPPASAVDRVVMTPRELRRYHRLHPSRQRPSAR